MRTLKAPPTQPHRNAPLQAAVEARLGELAPDEQQPPQALSRAIRYSLLGPGKRARPLLTLLATVHCGGDWRLALDPACAVEMVHTASLILDDLPAMDDADLRRGRPTTHRAFGEDMAVLAAVALLNQAFAVLAQAPALTAPVRLDLVARLSSTLGPAGLIAGQSRDLHERAAGTPALLEDINRQKTGVLFGLSAELGARIANAGDAAAAALRAYANALGLAFQARDDLLDRTGSAAGLGKPVGQDRPQTNLVDVMGEQAVQRAIRRYRSQALAALEACPGRDDGLAEFARGLLDGH